MEKVPWKKKKDIRNQNSSTLFKPPKNEVLLLFIWDLKERRTHMNTHLYGCSRKWQVLSIWCTARALNVFLVEPNCFHVSRYHAKDRMLFSTSVFPPFDYAAAPISEGGKKKHTLHNSSSPQEHSHSFDTLTPTQYPRGFASLESFFF